ncbi:MAG: ATP-binding protein [Deltaproteobacteria bacterium]|jgi:hypothetical protein|nr:ATP-binding protein [Deltaproteobacteria bacterium]
MTFTAGEKLKGLVEVDLPFEKYISQDALYVDKTSYIYSMVSNVKRRFLFLSRPRRFGKTLLLDTLNELFLGHRHLFDSLWIGRETDYDFQPHPVIRLSMNYAKTDSSKGLENFIRQDLLAVAKSLDIPVTDDHHCLIVKELLDNLHAKHGRGAVILIDEYDASVARYIDDPYLAQANSVVLHDFYSVLKEKQKKIRFVFVTGITRFAMTALDSGPNNFKDISLLPEYGGVCGFTVSEFDRYFGDRMEDLLQAQTESGYMPPDSRVSDLREKILAWYDGYNWLGPERVLNPYALVNLFADRIFDDYWVRSGQPSHLKMMIRQRPQDFLAPQTEEYLSSNLRKVDLQRLKPVPVLFHSGYLTIDKVIFFSPKAKVAGKKREPQIGYTFKFPNSEVETGYEEILEDVFGRTGYDSILSLTPKFLAAVDGRDSETVGILFINLLSSITFCQHTPEESFYHALFQGCLASGGLKVSGEVAGAVGRSDIIAERPGGRYLIIEVKYRKKEEGHTDSDLKKELAEASKEALKQIVDNDYAGPIRGLAKEITGLSLAVYGRKHVRSDFVTKDLMKPQPVR